MLSGIPPELEDFIKEINKPPKPYDPLNKTRKKRSRKNLHKKRIAKMSRKQNRKK